MKTLLLSSTSDFLTKNLWWIIAIVVIVAVVVYLLVTAIISSKKKSTAKIATKSEYLAALGGEDNILEKELKGSRIIVKLQDYSKVDQDKLKEAGVTGFIEMSDKLTLVIKDNADKAFEVIFGSKE